ncbi:hypothetical protein [Paracoccus sp. KR1-242]|uniref:hypothetical protein n=1 Tax=Paracoccus sp. KR1-242 TaxID=3410028 RepID=UPI003C05A8B9
MKDALAKIARVLNSGAEYRGCPDGTGKLCLPVADRSTGIALMRDARAALFDLQHMAQIEAHRITADPVPTLRACPFCKAEGDEHVQLRETVHHLDVGSYSVGWSIFCINCGIEMSDEYRDALVARWNGQEGGAS